MKRSASPLSGQASATQPRKKRLISVISALKSIFSSSSTAPKSHQESTQTEEASELPTSFVSHKRKSSIRESMKRSRSDIPRCSVSVPPAQNILESLYDSARSQRDEEDTDGEYARLGADPEDQLMKEVSPSVHVPKTRHLPQNPSSNSVLCSSDELNFNPEKEYNQLVLDHEYPEQVEDNSTRPSFINLDPRERYQLLQMKKAMQATEYLESRFKYMVNPDETTSVVKQNNKVDSITQTHTESHLHNSLNFSKLRTKLARNNRRQKGNKRGLGTFSGEFFYEPTIIDKPSNIEQKLHGVLGKVNKPQFTKQGEPKLDKGLPDADARESVANRRVSFSQRPGLENTLRFAKSRETLDDDYVKKIQSNAKTIQLKDQPLQPKPGLVGPSSAFKFEIQKEKIDSIFSPPAQETDTLKQQKETPSIVNKPAFLLGTKAVTKPFANEKEETPKVSSSSFSFNKPSNPKSAITESADQSLAGKFGTSTSITFGGSTVSGGSKPFAFPIGGAAVSESSKIAETEKPIKIADAKSSTAPSTLFNNFKEGSSPAFTFGKPAKAAVDKSFDGKGALFSFDSKKSDGTIVPIATNGNGPETGEETGETNAKDNGDTSVTAEGNEQKSTAPKFSFNSTPTNLFSQTSSLRLPGATSSAESDQTEDSNRKRKVPGGSSTSIFGATPAADPSTSSTEKASSENDNNTFGIGSKISLFGAKSATQQQNPAEGKTAGFGNLGGTPKFSFGNSEAKAKEMPKFSFGNPEEKPTEKPKFSFGNSEEKPTEKPKFSFGNSEEKPTEKPKFSFGNSEEKPKELPKFSFGNSEEKPKELPKFSFGGMKRSNDATSDMGDSMKDKKQSGVLPQSSDPKPPAASVFQFGATSQPTTLARPISSSSEPTPAPSFSFSNPQPQKASNSASVGFNFGQSSTADPASIFGAKTNGPAPAFNFSMTSKPTNNADQATPFGAASKPAVGFNFGNTTAPTFGGSRPATPANVGSPFGVNNQFGGAQASGGQAPSFGGFNTTAPSSVFGDTSRSVTPSFGGFEQNLTTQPNSQSQQNGFSFSSNTMGGFHSASASFGQTSREGTPPAFSNPMGGASAVPPVANMNGRKIAQMRARKRR